MTQRIRALQNEITTEMRLVAAYENMEPEAIREGVASGKIAIPCNIKRKHVELRAVGGGTRIKVNANIGASPNNSSLEEELHKLEVAVRHGADSIMDLSLGGDQLEIRHEILKKSPVMVGTVPLYQTAFELSVAGRDINEMTADDFLKTIEKQAVEGVDFMTIHAGVTRKAVEAMEYEGRALDVVSRGGAFLVSWLRHNSGESPIFDHYDDILDILRQYDVTISLGDGMRPGTTCDATDRAQLTELLTLGELTQRAWEKGVQVIVEGPGHVPLQQVAENMTLQKNLCHDAPFYVLGPLVTDRGCGNDHIVGAIGGALAGMNGADFLCYVTPGEHLRLPTPDDVENGVIASRIAAHVADLSLGRDYALKQEQEMAAARKSLDWPRQIALSFHPEKAQSYRDESAIGDTNVCTMCGEFCAIKKLMAP